MWCSRLCSCVILALTHQKAPEKGTKVQKTTTAVQMNLCYLINLKKKKKNLKNRIAWLQTLIISLTRGWLSFFHELKKRGKKILTALKYCHIDHNRLHGVWRNGKIHTTNTYKFQLFWELVAEEVLYWSREITLLIYPSPQRASCWRVTHCLALQNKITFTSLQSASAGRAVICDVGTWECAWMSQRDWQMQRCLLYSLSLLLSHSSSLFLPVLYMHTHVCALYAYAHTHTSTTLIVLILVKHDVSE